MQIISPIPMSKITFYREEIKDWPKDSNWIATGAIDTLFTSRNTPGSVAVENEQGNLIAIGYASKISRDKIIKTLDFASAFANAGQVINKGMDEAKSNEDLDKYLEQQKNRYSTLSDNLIGKIPSWGLNLNALSGIGMGGASAILKYYISISDMIILSMYDINKNLSFYSHFGFQRLEKTKWMYYIKLL